MASVKHALALIVFCLLPAAAASASPTISEYGTGLAANADPLSITTATGETLWFTEAGPGNALGAITTSGAISAPASAGPPAPLEIAHGPDGKLWFTEVGGAGKVGTVDPLTNTVSEYALPAGSSPVAITGGAEGNVWFTTVGGAATIDRISPTSHEIREFEVPTKPAKPDGIALGPEGAIWFTESGGGGAIGRLDPSTGAITEYTAGLTKNASPTGIATGPDGQIWFTEAVNPGRIGRLDPATGAITEFSAGLTVGTPEAIAAGSDGNLYFTESNSSGAIGQITPAGVITEYKSGLSANGKPTGIASGPDGNIWFTESANPAKIGRLSVAPSVSAAEARNITASGATLSARVGSNAQTTTYFFEYGSTTAYGSRLASGALPASGAPAAVESPLAGLAAESTLHFRLVAANASGTTYGRDATFTTAAAPVETTPTPPPPTPPPPPLTSSLPPAQPLVLPPTDPVAGAPESSVTPAIGRSAGLVPVSGTIRVRRADGSFEPLDASATLPLGAEIDATHGVLKVVTALDRHGRSQAATVWGGLFDVGQGRNSGLTSFALRGQRLVCPKRGATTASIAKRAQRHSLWSEDSHGSYSTHGANSVATVLGTRWETIDSCAGTLTKVARGRVRVHDLRSHETLVVSAGHSYLARP